MRLGAADYLLKVDLTAEKLLQALRPLQRQTDHTQDNTVPQHMLRAHLMKNILSGFFLSERELKEQCQQAAVLFESEPVWCMALRVDFSTGYITDEAEYQTICLSLINITEEIVGDALTAFCAEGYTGEFFVLGTCNPSHTHNETACIKQLVERLILMLNQYLDLHVSIGISRGAYTIQGLFQACRQARLSSRMAIWEQADLLFAKEADASASWKPISCIPQLHQAIQTNNQDLFQRMMKEAATGICEPSNSLEEQCGLASELLMHLQESIRKSGWKQDLSAAMERQRSALAEQLQLTPGYLSILMKRDLGMTFSEYVLHVCMEHARKLLKQGQLRVYEVAECVGYSNPYYFNMLFKRTFGITPGQYSKNRGKGKEKT